MQHFTPSSPNQACTTTPAHHKHTPSSSSPCSWNKARAPLPLPRLAPLVRGGEGTPGESSAILPRGEVRVRSAPRRGGAWAPGDLSPSLPRGEASESPAPLRLLGVSAAAAVAALVGRVSSCSLYQQIRACAQNARYQLLNGGVQLNDACSAGAFEVHEKQDGVQAVLHVQT